MENGIILFIVANILVFVNSYPVDLRDLINQNKCNFPPIYLASDERYAAQFQPCSQPVGVLTDICATIRSESSLCSIPALSKVPVTNVTLELFNEKTERKEDHLTKICGYMTTLPWTETECQKTCTDTFFICDLYVVIDKVLRRFFEMEIKDYTCIHDFVHSVELSFLFPYPPRGSLDNDDLLGKCGATTEDETVKQLCNVMTEVSVMFLKNRVSAEFKMYETVLNVTSEWDPCKGMSAFSTFSTSNNFTSLVENCANVCANQTGICKMIYLGLEKYQQAVAVRSAQSSVRQQPSLTDMGSEQVAPQTGPTNTGSEQAVSQTGLTHTGEGQVAPQTVLTNTGEGQAAPKTSLTHTGEGQVAPQTVITNTGEGQAAPQTGLTNTGSKQAAPQTGLTHIGEAQVAPLTVLTNTGEGQMAPSTGPTNTGSEQAAPQTGPTNTGSEQAAPQTGLSNTGEEQVAPQIVLTNTGEGQVASQTGLSNTGEGQVAPQTFLTNTGEGQAAPQTGLINTGEGQVAPQTVLTNTGEGQAAPQTVLTNTGEGQMAPQTGPTNTGSEQAAPQTGLTNTGGQVAPQTGLTNTGEGQVAPQTGLTNTGEGHVAPQTVLTNTGEGQAAPQTGSTETGSEQAAPQTGLTNTGSEQAAPQTGPTNTGSEQAAQQQGLTNTGSGQAEQPARKTQNDRITSTASPLFSSTDDYYYTYGAEDEYIPEYVFKDPPPSENQLDKPAENSEINKKPEQTNLNKAIGYATDDEDSSGGHFMAYFLVFIVLSIAGYIVFHNKQKIIALVIEGKTSKGGRRPSTKDYKQLKTEDVMPSLEKSAYSKDYVF